MADPHLHERGLLQTVDHPELGPLTVFTSPIRLDGARPEVKSLSPGLGADNDSFYTAELGLSAEEIAALRERKVI